MLGVFILVLAVLAIVILIGVLEMSLSQPGAKRTLPRILRAFARNWKQAPMMQKVSLVVSLAALLATYLREF